MRVHRLPLTLVQLLTVGTLFFPAVARAGGDPLMGSSPWDFQPQNRAAMAIAIRNAEEGFDNFHGVGGNGDATTIVCGGASGAPGSGATGSAATATANSSCVIISNSDGSSVNVGQTSVGDQTADAKAHSNIGPKKGSIDEVAAALGMPTP